MPRTNTRTVRTRTTTADATTAYRDAGRPRPLSMARAKRAARAHFKATPGSAGSWRGWVNVKSDQGKFIVQLQITRAKSGSSRIGGVSVVGTVNTGR